MITREFKSVLELFEVFTTEQACIDHLEQLRWNGNVVSPFDSTSKVYKCKDNKYRCKNTGKYFNVKTNTLFDNSNVPLRKWFAAIWLVTCHKKGISSLQLSRDIDVTQKTAWFMLQRIRNCFGIENNNDLTNTVELNETYVGGKNKNRHADKKVEFSETDRAWAVINDMVARGEIEQAVAIARKPLNAELLVNEDFVEWLNMAETYSDFYASINRITANSLAVMKVEFLKSAK